MDTLNTSKKIKSENASGNMHYTRSLNASFDGSGITMNINDIDYVRAPNHDGRMYKVVYPEKKFQRCGVNEVEEHECVLFRKMTYLETKSPNAIRDIINDKQFTFYAEHFFNPPYGCNPRTFGSKISDKLRFEISGNGLCGGMVGQKFNFSVQLCSSTCDNTIDPNTVIIQSRLVGDAIYSSINFQKTEKATSTQRSCCNHVKTFEFMVFDSGDYWLEIMASRVGTLLMNQLVYRGRLRVASKQPDSNVDPNKTLCQHSNHVGSMPSGRWLMGAAKLGFDQINDAFGYNNDYVWVPFDCYYRPILQRELRKCLEHRHINSFVFSGDSLGREMMSNTFQFIVGKNSSGVDGRKLKTNTIGKLQSGETTLWWVGGEFPSIKKIKEMKTNVFMWAPAVVMGLYHSQGKTDTLIKKYSDLMPTFSKTCRDANIDCYLFLNPTVQRHSVVLDDLHRKSITRSNVQEIINELKNIAQKLKISVIDASITTDARWLATWDGIHYTRGTYSDKDQSEFKDVYQWQGGVSWMNTLIFLNMVCNRNFV